MSLLSFPQRCCFVGMYILCGLIFAMWSGESSVQPALIVGGEILAGVLALLIEENRYAAQGRGAERGRHLLVCMIVVSSLFLMLGAAIGVGLDLLLVAWNQYRVTDLGALMLGPIMVLMMGPILLLIPASIAGLVVGLINGVMVWSAIERAETEQL